MTAFITTVDGLQAEFLAELQSHSYGIKSFTPPTTTAIDKSSASIISFVSTIHLLDSSNNNISGNAVTVTLDTAGYTVESFGCLALHVGRRFESLTALLSELSPEFNSAMHRSLSARLLAFSNLQSNSDSDEGDESECL
ncbi:hypothetical protein GGF37_001068 [Kickxella alabastrina]|nr:hypothetical protein GGF37_001068 [Kickxella alabastrina]